MSPRSSAAAVLLLLAGLATCWQGAAAANVCLLKLTIDPKQSKFVGTGSMKAPIEGKVSQSKLTANGHVWLRVPSSSSCPPNLTASNADDLLEQASLEVPLDTPSIAFTPKDAKTNVTANGAEPGAAPIANLDLNGFQMGLTGTEPLGPGTVTVGKGSVSEAKAASGDVCSQLVLLNGTLDMSSKLSGPRVAEVKNVAFNRTLGAGLSVTKAGDSVSNATLFLSNVTLLWNITPETADGKGTPGVEFTKATYQLVGDVVATADLADKASWKAVKPEEVAWGTVRRLDSAVLVGASRPGKPRYIGVNSTIPQECKPTRVLDGAGAGAGAGTTKSAAQGAAANLLAAVAAAGLALLAL